VPGWDCHGLPIELEALREFAGAEVRPSADEIRLACEKQALHYVREQKRQFQLLGTFADWDRPYLTMSPSYEAGVLTVFLDMVEKGYVYRDLRPISWCYSCRTALAEAEIEYKSRIGRSIFIYFEATESVAALVGSSAKSVSLL